jgi:glycosyltransferase involved in cell wall biosynthesis
LKISIITPSFNSVNYIERAIKSVLSQDYDNWEHIIVDGGSMDGTLEILKKYPHLVWVSEPDRGQSDAMNKGFQMSTGEIIGYLNADDWYKEDALQYVNDFF